MQTKLSNKVRGLFLISSMFILLSACGGSGGGSGTVSACSAVSGQASTNGGGSTSNSSYSLNLGSGQITFNNINLTFRNFPNGINTLIVDAGAVCLSSISTWPGGGTSNSIAATVGDAYIVQFNTVVNGVSTLTYAKFTVNSYAGGVIGVTYVPNL